ncbi:dihydrofolate reductase [Candidatus Saccharibacteria bacterium]|nr:dihydrofolate reductase [Candidatus Saccharibacteria bacterium]
MNEQGRSIAIIVAVAENGAIGSEGGMPAWRLPDDLARFKVLTMGEAIVMGRKTFESIGSKPLPGRRNIVVTRQLDFAAPGCDVVHSLHEALALTAADSRVWIIGGGQLFEEAMPQVDRMEVTLVHAAPKGDTFFTYNPGEWHEVFHERHEADERHSEAFDFISLVRPIAKR